MPNCVASYYIGLSNVNSVTGFGNDDNPITNALKEALHFRAKKNNNNSEPQDQPMQDAASETTHSTEFAPNTQQFPNALRLFTGTYDVVCRRWGDPNILPFLHISLVFVYGLTFCSDAIAPVAPLFPWKLTALMLNTLIESPPSASPSPSAPLQDISQPRDLSPLLEKGAPFPGLAALSPSAGDKGGGQGPPAAPAGPSAATTPAPAPAAAAAGTVGSSSTSKNVRRGKPLPDDYALRGFLWSDRYFPEHWFDTEEKIDDDEKYFELPSMMEERRARLVWLGGRIAEYGTWLRLEEVEGGGKRFGVHPQYEVALEDLDVRPLPPTPVESVEYGELPDAATDSSSWSEPDDSGKPEVWQDTGDGVRIVSRR